MHHMTANARGSRVLLLRVINLCRLLTCAAAPLADFSFENRLFVDIVRSRNNFDSLAELINGYRLEIATVAFCVACV